MTITPFERRQIQEALAYVPKPKRLGKTRPYKERGCSVQDGQWEAFLVRQAMAEAESRRGSRVLAE